MSFLRPLVAPLERRFVLVHNAAEVWRHSWAVRLSLVAALLSAVDIIIQYMVSGQPAWVSIGTGLFSFGAAVSRVFAQAALTPDDPAKVLNG